MVSKVVVFYLILVSNSVWMTFSSNINNMLKSTMIYSYVSPIELHFFEFYSYVNYLKDSITPNLVDTIAMGAQMAMDHCQMAFKWNRWNCPESTFTR